MADGSAPKPVLVVDDNIMARKMVIMRLRGTAFPVLAAASGEEALDLLTKQTAGLVFLDLIMPGLGGLDVLRRMKKDQRLAMIPVVMISGVEDMADIEACFQAGAEDFLLKPVSPGVLDEVLADFVDPPAGNLDVTTLPVFDGTIAEETATAYGGETVLRLQERFKAEARILTGKAVLSDMLAALRRLKVHARALGLRQLLGTCRLIERADRKADVQTRDAILGRLPETVKAAVAVL